MNPEQWLSLKWNGGSTMSDRWLNQSKIIQVFAFGAVQVMILYVQNRIIYINTRNRIIDKIQNM